MSGGGFLGFPGSELPPLADVVFRSFWKLNRGSWSSSVSYRESDIVISEGSSYQCIRANLNIEPPNTTFWREIVSAGTPGTPGANGDPGPTGPTGPAGSVTAASALTLEEVGATPTTSANELKVYNLSNSLRARLESDGEELVIAIAGKQTIYIPASAIAPRISSGCAALERVESGSSTGPNIAHLAFDSAVDEYGQFEIDFPKSWDLGTLTAQFVWTGLTSDTGDVTWGIQAVAEADNDAIDTAYGTAVMVTDTFLTANDRHITSESSSVTVGGSPSVGDSICFQVFRDTSGSTRAADANLIGIRLYFTTDKENDA